MNSMQTFAAVGAGIAFLGALLFGPGRNRERDKLMKELETLAVLANEVRDPVELARVTARASVLSAKLLQQVVDQLTSVVTEQRRATSVDEQLNKAARDALAPLALDVKRLLQKIAGEGEGEPNVEPDPTPATPEGSE